MGLHREARLPLELSEAFHQLVGAGGGEARGEDRGDVPVLPLRLGNPPRGVLERGGRALLPQDVGAVAVHVDLAHQRPDARLLNEVHQQLGRGAVDRPEHRRPGGRGGRQVVSEDAVGPPGVGGVGVFCLLGEGVGIQPVEQLEVHAQRPEGILGRVQVQVDEAGDDQPVPAVLDGNPLELLGQLGKNAGGLPFLADEVAFRHADNRPGGRRMQNMAPERESCLL